MRWFFTAALLLICFTGFAQNVLYSDFEKFDLRTGNYSVVGKVGGLVYTYRSYGKEHFLDAWDDSMQRRATVILDFFPERIYDTKFVTYTDRIVAFFQGNEGGKITQQVAMLDEKGRLQGKVKTIDAEKAGFFGPSGGYYDVTVSDDKRNFIVYRASVRGSKLQLKYFLLNDTLQVVSRGESTYEGDNNLSILPGILDNAGNFYLPVVTTVGSRDYADGAWVLKLAAGSKRMMAKEIPLYGKFATGLYLKADNTARRIYVGGFYSEKKAGNHEGTVFATVELDSVRVVATLLPFDDRMRMASGQRNARKAFNDFQARQIILRNDGGFVLLAEDYFMTVRNGIQPYGFYTGFYSTFMNTQNIREYRYGDILALSYTPDRKLEWYAFARKDQYSQEDNGAFSSYAFVNTGASLGFVYNDFDFRQSKITLATLDNTGQVSVVPLPAGGGSDPDWLPKAGRQVSAHELIVPCLKRRQICFAKVVF